MGRYRAVSPLAEPFIGDFAKDEFEHDFASPAAEQDAVRGGLVEIVPRKYRVLSDNYQHPQGEEFEAAYLMEHEAALIAGGHIERVEPEPKPTKRSKKTADESTDQPTDAE
ncbi:MAG TPA: hypothetical protein VGJ95_14060 [Pseudonocardiaceae bacterium]|jgi:hypothetical protein